LRRRLASGFSLFGEESETEGHIVKPESLQELLESLKSMMVGRELTE
jgi:hypothetical protein